MTERGTMDLVDANDRRYALRNLGRGVYIALSDDARELWVVNVYDEIGDAWLGDGKPLLGRFWRSARLDPARAAHFGLRVEHEADGTISRFSLDPDTDPGDLAWDAGGHESLQHRTRRDALTAAMRWWARD